MYTRFRVHRYQMSAWRLSILLAVLLLSGNAHALVCQQRGELPLSESAQILVGEPALQHSEDHRGGGVWHIHMEVPIECTWIDERGEALAAEQQSMEALHVYIDPSWQDPTLASMTWDISVDQAHSVYRVGQQMMVLNSNQHMPCFLIMRICDHRDEIGCRHWRNASGQDYNRRIALILPVDLYFHSPFPRRSYLAHLLLQVGSGRARPDIRSRLNVPVRLPSMVGASGALMNPMTAHSAPTPWAFLRPSQGLGHLSRTAVADTL